MWHDTGGSCPHKPDFKNFNDEEGFKSALKSLGIGPGQYMFSCCNDPSKFKDPEFKKQYEAGPHGVLSLWKDAPNPGRNLALTFLFFLVASVFVGYIGSLALSAESAFRQVFRVTGTAAIMAYTMAFIPNAIWFGRTFRSVLMDVIDGVAY
ncbi:MAG: hypothetical protein KJ645_03415, partial [Planctomycetes bacterium]|nr:hypothetical protein [Planctomycetota bacterium]